MTAEENRTGPPGVEPTLDALLASLASMPARLGEVAARATGDPGDGWVPREVALHLAAVEEVVWQARLRDLEAQDAPVWAWTEPGLASGARDETLGAALELFGARRAATLALVAALSPAARARVGTHATYGPLDLLALLTVAVDHDEHHLADLERLVPTERVAATGGLVGDEAPSEDAGRPPSEGRRAADRS